MRAQLSAAPTAAHQLARLQAPAAAAVRRVQGFVPQHPRQAHEHHPHAPRLCGTPARALHSRSMVATRAHQAASSGGSASHAGRALLHDFCMTIPYSAIALVSAVIAVVLKAPSAGMQLAGAGAAVALCSVLSLRAWRRGGSAVPFTLASTGASGWVAHAMWQRVAAGVAPVPSGVMLALSAALALFCVYNVLAGGNPPPGHKAQ